MHYAQAREYNPMLGRFASEDPIFDGANWYIYCEGNPLKFVDPLGLFCDDNNITHGHPMADNYATLYDYLRANSSFFARYFSEPANRFSMAETIVSSTVNGAINARLRFYNNQLIPRPHSINYNPRLSSVENYRRFLNNRSANARVNTQAAPVRGLSRATSRILRPLPYIAVGIDVYRGISYNLEHGNYSRIATDAIADVVVSGASVWAAGWAGAQAGLLIGSGKPIIGTIVGGVIGLAVGMGAYYFTDMRDFNGESLRDISRDIVYDFLDSNVSRLDEKRMGLLHGLFN